jgi:hypothetical protein
MSNKISTKVSTETFVERFIDLFETNQPAEIQRKLGIDYQSAKNYLGGRKPKAEVLELIAEKTGVCINWLLSGKGPKFLPDSVETSPDLLSKVLSEISEIENLDDGSDILEVIYFDISKRLKMKEINNNRIVLNKKTVEFRHEKKEDDESSSK